MSGEKIYELEKEIEVVKATINPLIDKIDENTRMSIELQKTNIELSHQISTMIERYSDVKDEVKGVKDTVSDMDGRLRDLEKVEYARESGEEMKKWITRGVILTLVGGGCSLVWFLITEYAKRGG